MLATDHRGVEGLPLRLLIIALVLSLSSPLLMDALHDHQESVDAAVLLEEGGTLRDAIYCCYLRGPGNRQSVDIDLPAHCFLVLGGDGASDPYTIRMVQGSKVVGTLLLDSPPVRASFPGGPMDGQYQLTVECVDVEEGRMVTVR
jgi:hypothetical protein